MTFAAHVKGGTGAGRKVQKTREPWLHDCARLIGEATRTETLIIRDKFTQLNRELPGTAYSCPDCGTRRP